jgi:hypothetical protein
MSEFERVCDFAEQALQGPAIAIDAIALHQQSCDGIVECFKGYPVRVRAMDDAAVPPVPPPARLRSGGRRRPGHYLRQPAGERRTSS